MKSYEEWAREIVTKVGTIGARQVMLEMQNIINELEDGYSRPTRTISNSTIARQVSAIERGNIIQR